MKTIKKVSQSILLILILTFTVKAQAQDRSNREKMEALKVAFITEKLELTENESKYFWPIYNDYQNERKATRPGKSLRENNEKDNFDEMTDSEIEKFISNKMEMEEKALALKRKYYERVKTVLPIRKVAKLSQVEKQFREEVLKRLKEKR